MATPIYFDESGYTGYALLDADQPYFAVASSLIGDEEAADILHRSFPAFRGDEFKFTSLWTKPRSRARLINLVAELSARRDRSFSYVVDKRFCVLTKLIDFLIEPVLHANGLDFYADSYASKFSNYAHTGLEVFGGRELYDATVQVYYDFVRQPDDAKLREVQRRLALMATSGPKELRFFYELAAEGAHNFRRFHDLDTFQDTFEIQLTCVFSSVGYWRNRLPDEFALFHDASNNFFGQRELWEALTAKEVPAQFHPQAFGPPIEFPLRVASTTAVDSKASPAIQLCDAIAGLTARCARPARTVQEGALYEELLAAGLGELSCNGINPGETFPDGPPAKLDGPDAVDQLLGIIANGGWKNP